MRRDPIPKTFGAMVGFHMTKNDTFLPKSSDLSVGWRPEFESDEFGKCIILVIEILRLELLNLKP